MTKCRHFDASTLKLNEINLFVVKEESEGKKEKSGKRRNRTETKCIEHPQQIGDCKCSLRVGRQMASSQTTQAMVE